MKFKNCILIKFVTDTRTEGCTDKPKAICPFNFSKVGGIRKQTVTKADLIYTGTAAPYLSVQDIIPPTQQDRMNMSLQLGLVLSCDPARNPSARDHSYKAFLRHHSDTQGPKLMSLEWMATASLELFPKKSWEQSVTIQKFAS